MLPRKMSQHKVSGFGHGYLQADAYCVYDAFFKPQGGVIASCKRCGVEPFAWFREVLSRIPAHSITRLSELLPYN